MRAMLFRVWLVVGLAALSSCSEETTTDAEPKVRPAKLVTVAASTNQRELTFPAVIQSAQSAELTFQIAGEIRELNVLEGTFVEAGDIIARLDQRDARNRLAQSQAEYDNAEAEFQRADRLFSEDAISRVMSAEPVVKSAALGEGMTKTPFRYFKTSPEII